MSDARKPPIHGRDHRPKGADPIPELARVLTDVDGLLTDVTLLMAYGIRYVYDNVGEWLLIESSGSVPDPDVGAHAGIVFEPSNGVAVLGQNDNTILFGVYTIESDGIAANHDELFAVQDGDNAEVRIGWNRGPRGPSSTTDVKIDTEGGDFYVDSDGGIVTFTDADTFHVAADNIQLDGLLTLSGAGASGTLDGGGA